MIKLNFFFAITLINFFIYIQKCLKLYQLNFIKKIKKDYKKNLVKDIKKRKRRKKEEKNKINNIVMDITKIPQKMKNKTLLSIEKNIIE